jgi:acetoacetate decarboxylase
VDRPRPAASGAARQAPVADFPVWRVIGAHHFLADLTLPFGRVVHDYNKQAEQVATAALAAE